MHLLILQRDATLLAGLEQRGCEVARVGSVDAACERLGRDEEAYDAMLVDPGASPLNLQSLCYQLHASERAQRVPLLLVTALREPEDVFAGMAAGADGIVPRSCSPDDLLGRIRELQATRESRVRESAGGAARVVFRGRRYEIEAQRERVLDYLAFTFEDLLQAQKREHEASLARERAFTARAERGRLASERQLADLLQQLPVLMWRANSTLTLEFLKGGQASSGFVGQGIAEVFGPDVADAHRAALAGEHVPFSTFWSGRHWEGSVGPVRQLDEQVTGVAAVVNDVTQRVEAQEALRGNEQQLRQASKMEAVGRLAGGIAHDFNNLLTAVGGYSKLLLSATDDARLTRYATQIEKASARAGDLVAQLLAFSRKQILTPAVISLNDVVEETTPLLAPVLGGHVEVALKLDPNPGAVLADPGQAQQVLMNLAINAGDAMPHGGILEIKTDAVTVTEAEAAVRPSMQPGRYVRLTVSDTGAGMPSEILEQIWEPFFSTKSKEGGCGLGLSTVYGIVKQSGGWIWATSEEGKGTSFELYLPRLAQRVPPASDQMQRFRPAKPPEEVLILLVEDEVMVRNYTLEILEAEGYRVLESRSSPHALELAAANPGLTLLLTDVVMPEINGAKLASRVRETHPGIRVLYMSGHTGAVLFGSHGVKPDAPLLVKPFSPARLLHQISEVLAV